MKQIRRCQGCSAYTLMERCGKCSFQAVVPKPAKYSPEDHYAAYRRKAKEEQLRAKGWL
ncbi:ribosome biogenesis protein [Candidatus Woesearchaeota archaeon]|nr:ribosome biogenesis protein [Candidatus Woesearchaeota archaeon]